MNFDLHDLFAKIIPGGILSIIFVGCSGLVLPDKLPDITYLFVSYFIGFLIDACAYRYQNYLYLLFFRKNPTVKILNGEKISGKDYSFLQRIKEKFGQGKWEITEKEKIWSEIYRHAIDGKRVKGFNDHWLGARNIFVAHTIALPVIFYKIYHPYIGWFQSGIAIVVALLVWELLMARAKARQYLFIKEVLDNYIFTSNKTSNTEENKAPA